VYCMFASSVDSITIWAVFARICIKNNKNNIINFFVNILLLPSIGYMSGAARSMM